MWLFFQYFSSSLKMKFKMLPLNQLKQDSHDCDDAFHRRALSFYFQPEIQAPCIILLPFLCKSVHKIQARHTGLHNAWFSCSCLWHWCHLNFLFLFWEICNWVWSQPFIFQMVYTEVATFSSSSCLLHIYLVLNHSDICIQCTGTRVAISGEAQLS